jgi:hypothetical protein
MAPLIIHLNELDGHGCDNYSPLVQIARGRTDRGERIETIHFTAYRKSNSKEQEWKVWFHLVFSLKAPVVVSNYAVIIV